MSDSNIEYLKHKDGKTIYPVTMENAIVDEDGEEVIPKIKENLYKGYPVTESQSSEVATMSLNNVKSVAVEEMQYQTSEDVLIQKINEYKESALREINKEKQNVISELSDKYITKDDMKNIILEVLQEHPELIQ